VPHLQVQWSSSFIAFRLVCTLAPAVVHCGFVAVAAGAHATPSTAGGFTSIDKEQYAVLATATLDTLGRRIVQQVHERIGDVTDEPVDERSGLWSCLNNDAAECYAKDGCQQSGAENVL